MNNSGPQWVAEWCIAMIEQTAWLVDRREQKTRGRFDFYHRLFTQNGGRCLTGKTGFKNSQAFFMVFHREEENL